MLRTLIVLLALAFVGLEVWSWRRVSVLREQNRSAQLRIDHLDTEVERWRARSRGLEGELYQALDQARRMRELVAERAAAERAKRATPTAPRVMPPAIRTVLTTINDCLEVDGHSGFRLMFATDLVDEHLCSVEAVERDARALTTTTWVVERLGLSLDRSTGRVTLRLVDGVVIRDGRREPLPEGGEALVFGDVDGPMWERRLGHMLEVVGEYPADEESSAVPTPRLDRISVEIWRRRLEALLATAETGEMRYQVGKLRDLVDGEFSGVLIHGVVGGKLLRRSIEADRLTVEVDAEAGIVELVVRGGVLHETSGAQSISKDGYRMFLPGIDPAHARRVMLGMVRSAQ